MKSFVLLVLMLTTFLSLYSQSENEAINISTYFDFENELFKDHKQKSKLNITSAKLSKAQIEKIIKGFFKNIEENKKLTDYKFPLNGNAIRIKDIERDIYKLENGDYLLEQKENTIAYKNGNIYSDKDILISKKGNNYYLNDKKLIDVLSGLEFFENWSFDIEKGRFNKEVKQIGLCTGKDAQHLMGFKNNEYKNDIYINSKTDKEKYALSDENILIGKVSYFVNFRYNPDYKYQNICPENNSFLYYIEPGKRNKLIKDIFLYIREEHINKKNKVVFNQNKKNKLLRYNQIISEIVDTNNYVVINEYGEQDLVNVVEYNEFNDIAGIKFYESWYFNPANFSFKKVVNSISLVEKVEAEDSFIDPDNYYLNELLYIKLKNEQDGKISPFFNDSKYFVSNDLIADTSDIYTLTGENITKSNFDVLSEYFYGDLMIVGKKTGTDTILVFNDWGNMIDTIVPIISYGLINKKAEIILPVEYNKIDDFTYGCARVSKSEDVGIDQKQDIYGIVNENGEVIIACKYEDIIIKETYLAVMKDGKWGITDHAGKVIVQPQFDSLEEAEKSL